jgi:diguanylate cyclase (GGDEF)-like protein/PAS domain S-box-containing protein
MQKNPLSVDGAVPVAPAPAQARCADTVVSADGQAPHVPDSLARQRDVMKTIIDNFPGAISLCDTELRLTAHNDQFMTLLDFPPELFAKGWAHLQDLARFNAQRGEYGPGDPEQQVQVIVERTTNVQAHCMERQRPNGQWLEIRGMPIPSGGFVTSYMDITERKQAQQYEQLRSEVLEMLAHGDPLSAILGAMVRGIERIHPRMLCGVRLIDGEGRHLTKALAPSLPIWYNEASALIDISSTQSCCAVAAAAGERVVAQDLLGDLRWVEQRELASRAGLGACWSQPICCGSGRVLGTFDIYHRVAAQPTPADAELMEQTARLASIAIERNAALASLRDGEAHYRLLTEDVSDVIWRTDHNNRFVYISPADERLRGYRSDEVLGHHVFEMFTEEGVAVIMEKMKQRRESELQGIQTGMVAFEAQHRCKDDRVLWVEVFSTPERDASGAITGFHGINRDITKRKQLEEQIRQLAFYDPLTQLPNRRLLGDRLHQALLASHRAVSYGALMVLDLDRFKLLNDTHGHAYGDLLLVEVSRRLLAAVRQSDTVARFGGDEFVVLLGELGSGLGEAHQQAATIAEKIRAALAEPYQLHQADPGGTPKPVAHHCSTSVGVALFGPGAPGQDEVFKAADAAMYQAKAAGRNAVRFDKPGVS